MTGHTPRHKERHGSQHSLQADTKKVNNQALPTRDSLGSAFMVAAPGVQLAGHTSPCSSVNCSSSNSQQQQQQQCIGTGGTSAIDTDSVRRTHSHSILAAKHHSKQQASMLGCDCLHRRGHTATCLQARDVMHPNWAESDSLVAQHLCCIEANGVELVQHRA